MYANPVLFPQISNRESWIQTVQIFDDDTGDLITLVDGNGNALYAITLEILFAHRDLGYSGCSSYSGTSPWYGGDIDPVIYAQLAQGANALTGGGYISIVDSGTINIQVPKSIIQSFRRNGTYDVFLTLDDTANDDGRQILIGKLPIFNGGRST